MLQYHYSYGNEDVLGSRIKVIKELNSEYIITFEQEGCNPEYFDDINVSKYHTLISKKIKDEDGYMYKRVITLIVNGKCNPKPEELFKIS